MNIISIMGIIGRRGVVERLIQHERAQRASVVLDSRPQP